MPIPDDPITRADGRQVMRDSVGAFPNMTPPEPDPDNGSGTITVGDE